MLMNNKREVHTMYEDALELLHSRDADIQNDKENLHTLTTTSLSVPKAWDKIVHIRNGAIRHAACRSFLNVQIGQGEVRQTGDTRVIYSLLNTTILLPGEAAAERQIIVSFDSLARLVNRPDTKSKAVSMEEKGVELYISLLKCNGSIPDRVKARLPKESEFWSAWACRLYYFFILHPCDIIHDRDSLCYWENLLDEVKQSKKNSERKAWEDWSVQRRTVLFFKEKAYPKLLLFELPIVIQINQQIYPVDKFFDLSGA